MFVRQNIHYFSADFHADLRWQQLESNEYFAEQRSHNWHNALFQKCSMNKRLLTKHLFLKITQPGQIYMH